jgi:hypothetical protein
MASLLAPSVLISNLKSSCEERPHTSRIPAAENQSRAEAQVSELESLIHFNTQTIAERRKLIEFLRSEQQDLLTRLAGFESLALKTMEKLAQAENFILAREERLRSLQTLSAAANQGKEPLPTGSVADRGKRALNRPAGPATV